jgi:hypothetical protein
MKQNRNWLSSCSVDLRYQVWSKSVFFQKRNMRTKQQARLCHYSFTFRTLYKEGVIKQTFLALLALFNWNYFPIAHLRQQNLKSWYSVTKHHISFRKNMIKEVENFQGCVRKIGLASNRVPLQHRRKLNLIPSLLSRHYLHFLLQLPPITVVCTGLQIPPSALCIALIMVLSSFLITTSSDHCSLYRLADSPVSTVHRSYHGIIFISYYNFLRSL